MMRPLLICDMKKTLTKTAFIAALASLMFACGAEPDGHTSGADGRGISGRDKIAIPPRAYYDALLTDRMELASSGALATAIEQVLWINFRGASVEQGYARGQSFLPCNPLTKIPASGLSAREQQSVTTEIAQFYSNAGVRIHLTLEEPTSGDYTTMHVGGSYANLGCPGGASVAGIAPFDTANANPNDVGFVFVKSKDMHALARTIAHESAHSFGLDHTKNKSDLMYPTDSPSQTAFSIGDTDAGVSQDGPSMLQAALGSGSATISGNPVAATTQPVVVAPTPQNNVTNLPNIPAGLPAIPGLASLGGLSAIASGMPAHSGISLGCVLPSVLSGAIPASAPLPNSTGALAVLTVLQSASMSQNSGVISTANLIGLLAGVPNVGQILTLAGIGLNTSQCLSKITPISIPGITAIMPGQLSSGINVAQILGMQSVSNPSQLIALLPQYAQVIGANAQGANAQSLMSIVMIAVAQQYQGMSFPTP